MFKLRFVATFVEVGNRFLGSEHLAVALFKTGKEDKRGGVINLINADGNPGGIFFQEFGEDFLISSRTYFLIQ